MTAIFKIIICNGKYVFEKTENGEMEKEKVCFSNNI